MTRIGSKLILATVLLAGCSKNKVSPAPSSPVSVPPVVIANAQAAATLITVSNGESYSSIYPNPVSLDGSDPNTKYNTNYTFNSGSNLAFDLVDVQANYECADGTQGHLTTTFNLTGGTGAPQTFAAEAAVPVAPNTDYNLQIVSTGDCPAKAHLALNVLAYLGISDASVVKPVTAEDCDGDGTTGPKRMLVFTSYAPYGILSADALEITPSNFTSTNLAVYLSSQDLCGTQISTPQSELSSFPDDNGVMVLTVQGSDGNSYDVTADLVLENDLATPPAYGSLNVTCMKNGQSFAAATEFSCRHIVVDANIYLNAVAKLVAPPASGTTPIQSSN